MNQRPPEVIRKFKSMDIGSIYVSSITVSELQYGVSKSRQKKRNAQRLNEFLAPFEILPYDEDAAGRYGAIRADLEKNGYVIGPLDMLIAAHALSKNLTLVTNNEREFQRIKNIRIENWAE